MQDVDGIGNVCHIYGPVDAVRIANTDLPHASAPPWASASSRSDRAPFGLDRSGDPCPAERPWASSGGRRGTSRRISRPAGRCCLKTATGSRARICTAGSRLHPDTSKTRAGCQAGVGSAGLGSVWSAQSPGLKIPWGETSGTRRPFSVNPSASSARGRTSPWLSTWARSHSKALFRTAASQVRSNMSTTLWARRPPRGPARYPALRVAVASSLAQVPFGRNAGHRDRSSGQISVFSKTRAGATRMPSGLW